MKYLRVEMPDGSKWDVPAEIIAKSRAAYYAKDDAENGEGDYAELYEKELAYTLGNDAVLMDWGSNNLNWADVKEHAVQVVSSKEADFSDGWVNGDKEVVEKP